MKKTDTYMLGFNSGVILFLKTQEFDYVRISKMSPTETALLVLAVEF